MFSVWGVFTSRKSQTTLREIKHRDMHTWCFRARAVHESKHVATGFGHGRHLGEHGEVVDDEGDLAALLLGQRLSVAQDAETCDICGCVSVEGVHEAGRCMREKSVREAGWGVSVTYWPGHRDCNTALLLQRTLFTTSRFVFQLGLLLVYCVVGMDSIEHNTARKTTFHIHFQLDTCAHSFCSY